MHLPCTSNNLWRFCSFIGIFILVQLVSKPMKAQQLPPNPFSIYSNPAQGLFFGAFYQGMMGGSVIVYPDGSRSSTGDVVPVNLGFPFSPAILEIEAPLGTRIAILNGPDATLSGSNGGTITLHIGSSDIGSPFVTTIAPPGRTQVRIGGTLYIGSTLANPEGSYNGMFSITFIQE
jgi:hypothetical protein